MRASPLLSAARSDGSFSSEKGCPSVREALNRTHFLSYKTYKTGSAGHKQKKEARFPGEAGIGPCSRAQVALRATLRAVSCWM